MEITFDRERRKSGVLIVDYFEDGEQINTERFKADDKFHSLVKPVFESGDFSGKWKETSLIYTLGQIPEERILLVGLGEKDDVSAFKVKVSFAHAIKKLRSCNIESISTFIDRQTYDKAREIATFLVEAAYMSQYVQPAEKKDKDEPLKFIEDLHFILTEGVNESAVEEGVAHGKIIGKIINETRDLINLPSNVVTPDYLAQYAKDIAESSPYLDCKVFDFEKLKEMKMGGIVSVGQGSQELPCLIECNYTPPTDKPCRTLALVGKGVTFDSGGISLKGSTGMYRMKADMSGAALVLHLVKAIALVELPIKVIGIVPACENMPDGNALKPGDIIKAYDGTSVEVHDTDAEGRLILMDGLCYAATKKPDLIIDLATLTGATIVALGRYVIGGMTNYEPIMNIMRASGDHIFERVWELPLMEEYKILLKTSFADIKNYGGREAGAITAGAFLSHFVEDIPWIHLDIAGVSWFDTETSLMPHGASGIGIRLIVDFLYSLLKADKPELWQKKAASIKNTKYREDEIPRARFET